MLLVGFNYCYSCYPNERQLTSWVWSAKENIVYSRLFHPRVPRTPRGMHSSNEDLRATFTILEVALSLLHPRTFECSYFHSHYI